MDPILEALKEFEACLGELASECERLADELRAEQAEETADHYRELARDARLLGDAA